MSGFEPVVTGGTWVSYYSDRSRFYVHATEIEALRTAVEGRCDVVFVQWGEELMEAVERTRKEARS